MKNTTRRVVILKNVNSDIIEQAILIIKDSATEENSKLLCEAERIVEKYMGNNFGKLMAEKKPTPVIIMSLGAAMICIGMIAAAFFV